MSQYGYIGLTLKDGSKTSICLKYITSILKLSDGSSKICTIDGKEHSCIDLYDNVMELLTKNKLIKIY
jgi:hypothetical protein